MNVAVLNRVPRFIHPNILHYQNVRLSSDKTLDPAIPTNQLKEVYSANDQSSTGLIYDKKPFKYRCEAGKTYSWCICGWSKSQPFCDGSHRNIFLKIKLRPIRFTVTETKDYWLCNCKRTANRPFCDGTHKSLEDQKKKDSK